MHDAFLTTSVINCTQVLHIYRFAGALDTCHAIAVLFDPKRRQCLS